MPISDKTPFTDRQLLVHLLEHTENLHDQVREIHEVFERFRPLLERLAPGGGAPGDYLTAMQLGREAKRRGRRGT